LAYKIEVKSSARKELGKLPKAQQRKVATAIAKLQDSPRHPQTEKLTDRGGEYRARAGEYRILYVIDDKQKRVTISAVRPRGSAYDLPPFSVPT